MSFILLLIFHQLGDFIFQSNEMVSKKKESVWWLLFHCAIYSTCITLVAMLWSCTIQTLLICLLVFVVHFVIDGIRIIIEKKYSSKPSRLNDNDKSKNRKKAVVEFWLLVFDQILHWMTLFLFSRIFLNQSCLISDISSVLKITIELKHVYIILCLITITSPVATFIKHLLNIYTGEDNKQQDEQKNAGYLIGILERLLVFTMALLSQYEAIGFVLAAKSLARFKEFEDKKFAEKYIIGTLASVGSAIMLAACLSMFK